MKKITRFLRLKYVGRETWLRNMFWSNLLGAFGTDSRIVGKIQVKTPENVIIGKLIPSGTGFRKNEDEDGVSVEEEDSEREEEDKKE